SSDAEAAARSLAALATPAERSRGEFLLGSAAYQRGQRAAVAAQLPDAEPFAWESARRGVQAAILSWCRAAELRPGWPEALRNAERAQRRLSELDKLREDAAKKQQTKKEPEPPPPKPPKPPTPSAEPPEEQVPELTTAALAPGELASLLQRLQEKEREKRQARQAAQRASATAGERDW
ncbi:MAG: hypothetical protein ABIP94_08540, partial [Planctomycetota bacterium]